MKLPILALMTLACGCASRSPRADVAYFPAAPSTPRVVHLISFNSLHDAVSPPRASFVDLVRGGLGSPYVATPAGIAYRSGHLYICDTGIGALHDWDLSTGRARRLGLSGETTLVKPVDVAVDDSSALYVADTGRGEVVVFDATGKAARRLKPPDRKDYRPVALAIHGSTLYVADIARHAIDLFSTSDGRHLGAFGHVGTGDGAFYYPMGVAATDEGGLLVSDTMNARVQVFDKVSGASPSHRLTFGGPGNRFGDMGKPRHLAIGPDGTVFITDAEFAVIHLYNQQGQLLMFLGGPADELGHTPLPRGVAVAETLPEALASLTPSSFHAKYFVFVTNGIGSHRISLFAVGQ